MKTIKLEILVKKRNDNIFDLHDKDSYIEGKTVSSDVRAWEFPQLSQIQTDKPLRATLIIEVPEREKGHYWVKYGGKWQIALWSPNKWHFACKGIGFDDGDLEEIDENRIERAQE